MDIFNKRAVSNIDHGLSLGRREIIRADIYHQKIDLALIRPDLKGLDRIVLACALPNHDNPVAKAALVGRR